MQPFSPSYPRCLELRELPWYPRRRSRGLLLPACRYSERFVGHGSSAPTSFHSVHGEYGFFSLFSPRRRCPRQRSPRRRCQEEDFHAVALSREETISPISSTWSFSGNQQTRQDENQPSRGEDPSKTGQCLGIKMFLFRMRRRSPPPRAQMRHWNNRGTSWKPRNLLPYSEPIVRSSRKETTAPRSTCARRKQPTTKQRAGTEAAPLPTRTNDPPRSPVRGRGAGVGSK